MKTIKEIGEFGFIRFLEERNRDFFNKVIKGIGDDCAVLKKDQKHVLLVSTELFIEDIHFLKEKSSPYELGIKVVNASLSDIAATGGNPLYLFTSIAIPKDTELNYLELLYKGIKEACTRYKVDLVGGDTSSSLGRIAINITIIGEAERDKLIYRKGAHPEDLIYVTGCVGDSAAGLMLIKEELSVPEDIAKKLLKAHNVPCPRLDIGTLVAKFGFASAMIDISDGLIADLNHICEASNAGAIIHLENLPISQELLSIKEKLPLSLHELVLYGGEDYELIIVVPPDKAGEFKKACDEKGFSVYLIGKMTKQKGIKLATDNKLVPLNIKGYTHF